MLYNRGNRREKMQTTQQFLDRYICKAGERVRQKSDNEWEIQKQTTRTFRVLGNVWASAYFDLHPEAEILALKLKPNSRRKKLQISSQLLEKALNKGWLIEEVRFKEDGRTPDVTYYRMGPGLWHYEQLREKEVAQEEASLLAVLQCALLQMEGILPNHFLEEIEHFTITEVDEEGWTRGKVQRFTHFLIAYLQLRALQKRMDYKEIGATYYKKIGGSKAFDRDKEDFIARLEKWGSVPVQQLGIHSLGTIVPVHFTGNLRGELSQYSIGTVHTTNDLAVMQEKYETNARYLWLVENRAVLTRMATEVQFLKETDSFILGVDGQVRGAHRQMIHQLCEHSSFEKVMIWVDHDRAGAIIARDLIELIHPLPYRLVGAKGQIFSSDQSYIQWLETIEAAEQEMTLGGVDNWKTWLTK